MVVSMVGAYLPSCSIYMEMDYSLLLLLKLLVSCEFTLREYG